MSIGHTCTCFRWRSQCLKVTRRVMAMCLRWIVQGGTDRPLGGGSSARSCISVRFDSAERVPVARNNGRGVTTLCAKKYEPVKVFEDNGRGIVCYRNEYGEVVCEGYDEGPHFYPTTSQQQEEQYRDDVKLYSILPEIRPYLVEGVDYECMDKEPEEISPEVKDKGRDPR